MVITGANRGEASTLEIPRTLLFIHIELTLRCRPRTGGGLPFPSKPYCRWVRSRTQHYNLGTLREYEPAEWSKLFLVKIKNSSPSHPAEAVEQLQSAEIESLNLVIAIAGNNPTDALFNVEDMDIEKLRHILKVNTLSYVRLFQATRPLLEAAADRQGDSTLPKFLAISSNAGSTVDMRPNVPARLGSYGVSKRALTYLVRRTHHENLWLTAWVTHPNFAQTDNSVALAKFFNLSQAPDTLGESVEGLVGRIDGATSARTSGKFFNIDDTALAF